MRGSTWIKLLGFVSVTMALQEGYILAHRGNAAAESLAERQLAGQEIEDEGVPSPSRASPPPRGPGNDPSSVTDGAENREKANEEEAQLTLQRLSTSEENSALVTALRNDSMGLQLLRGVLSHRHSNLPGMTRIYEAFLAELAATPQQGIGTIQEGLRRLAAGEFAEERIILIQAARTIPGMAETSEAMDLQEQQSRQFQSSPQSETTGPQQPEQQTDQQPAQEPTQQPVQEMPYEPVASFEGSPNSVEIPNSAQSVQPQTQEAQGNSELNVAR